MRTRFAQLAAVSLLALAAVLAACQPAPGGGSEAPAPESQAPGSDAAAPGSDAAEPAPSRTPYEPPNY